MAWLGHGRAEFFIVLFGCAKARLILVPLNWCLAVPELQALMADCTPGALIFDDEFHNVAPVRHQDDPELLLVSVDRGHP